jgi:hypothetical protein
MSEVCGRKDRWCAECPNWPADPFERALVECDRAEGDYRAVAHWRWFKRWRRWRGWTAKLRALQAFDLGIEQRPL